jgi:hypothetical protein
MDAAHATLIGAGVAAFGVLSAFCGVLIGQRMARTTQREQWVRDRKLGEYKELISSVNELFETLSNPLFKGDPDKQNETFGRCARIIDGCILIAPDIDRLELIDAILAAHNYSELTDNVSGFGQDRRIVSRALKQLARETLMK